MPTSNPRPIRFYVMVNGTAWETLRELSRRQRRTPADQAGVMLEDMLDAIEAGEGSGNGTAVDLDAVLERPLVLD